MGSQEGGRLGPYVHVVDPWNVHLFSELGAFAKRSIYAQAQAQASPFQFGKFMDPETFVIALQALFADTPDRVRVLRVIGNLKEEKVNTSQDDGTTQTVIARAGIVSVAEAQVPNPVVLAPYRTFREVEPLPSPFILRVKGGIDEDSLPSCALFEADGGEWMLEAIRRVAKWLEDCPLPEGKVLIA